MKGKEGVKCLVKLKTLIANWQFFSQTILVNYFDILSWVLKALCKAQCLCFQAIFFSPGVSVSAVLGHLEIFFLDISIEPLRPTIIIQNN